MNPELILSSNGICPMFRRTEYTTAGAIQIIGFPDQLGAMTAWKAIASAGANAVVFRTEYGFELWVDA